MCIQSIFIRIRGENRLVEISVSSAGEFGFSSEGAKARDSGLSRACIATHCLGALPSDLDRIVYTHTAPLYVIPPPLAPVSRAITLAE